MIIRIGLKLRYTGYIQERCLSMLVQWYKKSMENLSIEINYNRPMKSSTENQFPKLFRWSLSIFEAFLSLQMYRHKHIGIIFHIATNESNLEGLSKKLRAWSRFLASSKWVPPYWRNHSMRSWQFQWSNKWSTDSRLGV